MKIRESEVSKVQFLYFYFTLQYFWNPCR